MFFSGAALLYIVLDVLQSQYDTSLLELIGINNEINLALGKLREWAAPRLVEKNLLTISDEAYIQPEPLGVVLIIGAWNYPWAVTLVPLVGAIAAGTDRSVTTHCSCVGWEHILTQGPPHFQFQFLHSLQVP